MLVLALVLTQHDAFSVKATSMPMWAEMDKSRREAGFSSLIKEATQAPGTVFIQRI